MPTDNTQTSKRGALATLQTQNSAVSTSLASDANHKTILRLLLNLAISDTLSTAEQSDLEALAAQSPATGGSAVSTAQKFLLIRECEEHEERPLNPITVRVRAVTGVLKVYPNPVSDLLNVELPAAAQWSVFDLQGRLQSNGQSIGGLLPVPTGALSNGVYSLTLTYADGRKETTRFVVLH